MKKIYFLFLTVLITSLSFGQDLVMTGIIDGPLPGGFPKGVEFYVVNDIPDLSVYGIERAGNGAASTGAQTYTFPADAYLAGDYIYISPETPYFTQYLGIAPTYELSTSELNNNGDDAVLLYLNGVLNDAIGVAGVDGSGEAWEYLDGWMYRADGQGPSTTFVASEWTYSGANALDGCDLADDTGINADCGSVFPVGTYTATASTTPSLAITAPIDGNVFDPGTANVDISVSVQNFIIANGTGDGHIHQILTTPSGTFDEFKYDTALQNIEVADGESYTVFMELVDNTNTPITPAISATINFSVAALTTVTDIAALRADVDANGSGKFYEITGGSLVTHTDGFNDRKWIQDTNISGVLIFDAAGIITTTYTVGDMISGLKGTTSISNGVIQFIPTEDSGVIVSSGNPVIPQIITIPNFNAAPDDYESELIAFENVSFVEGDGTAVFATGSNYTLSDGTNTAIKRTDFFGADYIGTVIPSTVSPGVVGVAGEFNGTSQIYVRSLTDLTLSINTVEANQFNVFPNPVTNGLVNITSKSNEAIAITVFDILGKQVINKTVNNNTLNVAALTSGVYILKVSQNGSISTKKLVIK